MNLWFYQIQQQLSANIHMFFPAHFSATKLVCSQIFHFQLLGAQIRAIKATRMNNNFWLLFPSQEFQHRGARTRPDDKPGTQEQYHQVVSR